MTSLRPRAVDSIDELRAFLAYTEPGEQVTLTVLRGGEPIRVDVTLCLVQVCPAGPARWGS